MICDYKYNHNNDDEDYDINKHKNKNPTDDITEHENNICLFCFEYKSTYDNILLRLSEHKSYLKYCKCDGYTHKKCLIEWFTHDLSCPICRSKILENTYYNHLVVYNKYVPHSIRYIKIWLRSVLYVLRCFCYFCIIFHIIILNLVILHTFLK